MLKNPSTITVDNLTATIRGALLAHPTLTNFVVTGELRELKKHTSGHVYFTLLGENSRVSCAIFKGYASRILLWPKEGEQVAVKGKLDLYAPRGEYKVIGEAMIPIGVGAKARLRAALGKKLEAEGLFDPRVKRPLPNFPARVAVITSPTGAALQDVLKLHALRFPKTELIIVPSLMQGSDAKEPILKAFRAVARLSSLDAVMFVDDDVEIEEMDMQSAEDDANTVVEVVDLSNVAAPEEEEDAEANTIFTVVEQQPEFPGGEKALMEFIKKNLKYPAFAAENGIQGRVTLSFVVEKDGSVTDIQEMRSPSEDLTKEAKRVVGAMPKWKPGKQRGKPVRVKYVLPVTFRLQ